MKHLLAPITPDEANRRHLEALWEDAGPWIGASMEQHAEGLRQVLELADIQIAGSPIGSRLRAAVEPRDAEAEQLWLKLVRQRRHSRP